MATTEENELTTIDETGTDENLQNIETDFLEAAQNLTEESAELKSISVATESIISAYERYDRREINLSQLRGQVMAAESMLAGHGSIMASEGLLTNTGEAIGNWLKRIHFSTIKLTDFLQYSIKLFTLQRGRINTLRNRLTYAAAKDATFKVGNNKYLCFGEGNKVASDMQTYMQQFKLVYDVMLPFMKETASLGEDDLFSGLKWYKEAVFGELDDFMTERFTSLERHATAITRGVKGHVAVNKPIYTEYRSPVMLGCADVMVRTPKPGTYKVGDFEDMFAAQQWFYIGIDRKLKLRLSTLIDGSSTYTATKKDLLELLEMADSLLAEVTKLMSFGVRLSNLLGAGQSSSFTDRKVNAQATPSEHYKSVRIYVRISSILYDAVATGFTFTLGNIKQANTIVEKAVKRM